MEQRRSNRRSGDSRSDTRASARPFGRLVLVPIRSFTDAKSRLGAVLDDDQRRRLARLCAERVLAHVGPERAVVICNDDDVVQWSRGLDVPARRVAASGLNQSLEAAVPHIMAERQPSEIVVVHADLAFPQALDELDSIVPPASAQSVTIVPDRHRDGTNVLVLGHDVIPRWRFAYGPASFHAHCEQARSLGARVQVIEHPDLGYDLDTPQDLEDARVRTAVATLIPDWNSPSEHKDPDRHSRADRPALADTGATKDGD